MKKNILFLFIACLWVGCAAPVPRIQGCYFEYNYMPTPVRPPIYKFNKDSTFITDFSDRGTWKLRSDTLILYYKEAQLTKFTEDMQLSDIKIIIVDKESLYVIKKRGKLLQGIPPSDYKGDIRWLQLLWKDSETIRENFFRYINDTTGKKWTYEELFGPRPEKKKK